MRRVATIIPLSINISIFYRLWRASPYSLNRGGQDEYVIIRNVVEMNVFAEFFAESKEEVRVVVTVPTTKLVFMLTAWPEWTINKLAREIKHILNLGDHQPLVIYDKHGVKIHDPEDYGATSGKKVFGLLQGIEATIMRNYAANQTLLYERYPFHPLRRQRFALHDIRL